MKLVRSLYVGLGLVAFGAVCLANDCKSTRSNTGQSSTVQGTSCAKIGGNCFGSEVRTRTPLGPQCVSAPSGLTACGNTQISVTYRVEQRNCIADGSGGCKWGPWALSSQGLTTVGGQLAIGDTCPTPPGDGDGGSE